DMARGDRAVERCGDLLVRHSSARCATLACADASIARRASMSLTFVSASCCATDWVFSISCQRCAVVFAKSKLAGRWLRRRGPGAVGRPDRARRSWRASDRFSPGRRCRCSSAPDTRSCAHRSMLRRTVSPAPGSSNSLTAGAGRGVTTDTLSTLCACVCCVSAALACRRGRMPTISNAAARPANANGHTRRRGFGACGHVG
ncbi:hypothetical protein B0G69_6397, partial [Paraburkholderia sp. RAU2J]